ncbi:Glutathione S-transferase, N-terminal domain family protein [Aspergillus niger]|uniref:Uncharacterized protein n=2 Tax=Aspergillus TaxID=5052 RepID=A0A370PSZ5_ASPPH|nr:hypothetical protein M752DRAFT_333935 [Aspergillus phoenicis ATCC 13157]TPR08326.1 Glutathione S-transferase, N-terminal domain family protein [Aspergillus niger]
MDNLLQAIPFASVVLQEHVWDFPYPSLVATTTEPSSGRRTARDAATNDSEALSESCRFLEATEFLSFPPVRPCLDKAARFLLLYPSKSSHNSLRLLKKPAGQLSTLNLLLSLHVIDLPTPSLTEITTSTPSKMGPTKPVLPPLYTPKNMTFPSELRERTWTCLDIDRPIKEEGKDVETEKVENVTITPPPAYTEFINTFSPIFSSSANSRENFYKYMSDKPRPSPSSPPLTATSATFPSGNSPKAITATVPTQAPRVARPTKSPIHAQRMRLPAPYLYTPVSASPRSAHPLRSPFTPSDRRQRFFESPVSENGNTFCVRHIVTTTITYKRTPQLDPPPLGKRRKNVNRRTT